MKIQICLFPVMIVFLVSQASGESFSTNQWGAVTNGIRMSIALEGGDRIIETNEQFQLFVQIKNFGASHVSSYLENWANSDPVEGLHCVVISPSGRDVSPNVEFKGGSGRSVNLPPGGADSFKFDLSRICKFDEIGIYKITAQKTISKDDGKNIIRSWTVVSNPLLVKVCETNAENWGVSSNGVRLAITLEGGDREIQRNGEVKLLVRLGSREGTGAEAFFRLIANSDPEVGLHCVVLSPSGKDVSPNVILDTYGGGGRMIGSSVDNPASFSFDLSSICKFDEVGIYRITAEKTVSQMGKSWTVVSHPLLVTVVSGK